MDTSQNETGSDPFGEGMASFETLTTSTLPNCSRLNWASDPWTVWVACAPAGWIDIPVTTRKNVARMNNARGR